MIIRDDLPDNFPQDTKDPVPPAPTSNLEPPPPYTPGSPRSGTRTPRDTNNSDQYTSYQNRSYPQAVNYVSVHQPIGSIKCSYVLDPFLQVPKMMLPPLGMWQTEEMRKNLSLRARVGSIEADVTVLGDDSQMDSGLQKKSSEVKRKRVDMEARTMVGTLAVIVRDPPRSSQHQRLPFNLICSTQMGSITVLLPYSFHGFITVISSVGNVSISPEISANARWIDSNMRRRRVFVGDMRTIEDGPGRWTGDEVFLETPVGTVDIGYSGLA